MRERVKNVENLGTSGKVRLWVYDEAGFGRISKPKQCWCPRGVRPVVKCQHVRQYRQCYGACEPLTGKDFFLIFEKCDGDSFEIYLEMLSDLYPDDYHVMLCDGAGWHVSQDLSIPENVELFFIPSGTPEMNPMEQVWREIRTQGFHNQFFSTLDLALDRLCDTIQNLTPVTIKSIIGRDWLLNCFC